MYQMFKYKNIMPTQTYNVRVGERKIMTAFLQQELEEKAEYNKAQAEAFNV